MGFITNTFDGRTPPLIFLVTAWASTIQYFSEQVRIQKLPPSAIIGAIGTWEHKWKLSPTPLGGSERATGSREPDNKALQDKLDSVNGQVKRLQAAADRQSQAPTRRQRSRSPNGRGSGYYGGGDVGKRGGKGGGGGKGNKGSSYGGGAQGGPASRTRPRGSRGAKDR